MGGSQSNTRTNDIRAQMAQQEARHQRELEAVHEEMRRLHDELDMKLSRRARRHAKERRRTERLSEIREMQRREEEADDRRRQELEANLDREDLKENIEEEKEAEENFEKALRKQRELLAFGIEKKSKKHLEEMQKKEKGVAEEVEKAASKFIELKDKKLELQNKIIEDQEKQHNDYIVNISKRFEQTEQLRDEVHEIMITQRRNERRAEERNMIQKQEVVIHLLQVSVAKNEDRKEATFLNAVSNTRRAGNEATNAVCRLGDNAYKLKKKVHAEPEVVAALQRYIEVNVMAKMEELQHNLNTILEQSEWRNEAVPYCHKTAREIDDNIMLLGESLRKFKASLGDNPIDTSPELYNQVIEGNMAMRNAVRSLPVVSKNNYAMKELVSNTEKLGMPNSEPDLD